MVQIEGKMISGHTPPKYRRDIDGLRSVAVLAVVLFHAFPSRLAGGFVGVDVFFVISGFLISTIIVEGLNAGRFSFTDFYLRRVRRIFPSLITVLTTCLVIGWMALTPDEFRALGRHVAGGAGFVSNLLLWSEAGYFDPASDTKPLLHLWSLGIEEQFYLIWPLLLWLAWRSQVPLFSFTACVGLFSFGANVLTVSPDPTAAFYSPHTRFWELLFGGGLACFGLMSREGLLSGASRIRANALSFLGASLLLFGILRFDSTISFPGYWALVPVMGAGLVILAGPGAWLNDRLLGNRIAVWFGVCPQSS